MADVRAFIVRHLALPGAILKISLAEDPRGWFSRAALFLTHTPSG